MIYHKFCLGFNHPFVGAGGSWAEKALQVKNQLQVMRALRMGYPVNIQQAMENHHL
jgi:hypothetical protein